MIFRCLVGQQWWVGSGQARFDECPGGFLETASGGSGNLTQGPLPDEYGQPVHGGPDGVLDRGATSPVEHAGVDQFIEYRAELIQRISLRPCPAVQRAVGVLVGEREGGCEESWLRAGELQVCPADRWVWTPDCTSWAAG